MVAEYAAHDTIGLRVCLLSGLKIALPARPGISGKVIFQEEIIFRERKVSVKKCKQFFLVFGDNVAKR